MHIEVVVRGTPVTYWPEHWYCPVCGIYADDLDMAVKNFMLLFRAYCRQVGMA